MLLEKEAGCRDCYREKVVTGPKKIQSLAFSLSRTNGGGKKERRRKHIAWLQSSKEVLERGKEGGIDSSQKKTTTTGMRQINV